MAKKNTENNTYSIMGFNKVSSFELEHAHFRVSKYMSLETKFQLITISNNDIGNDNESLLLQGIFVVPTQLKDDSGIARVVQNMVLSGSKNFPFNKFLNTASKMSMCGIYCCVEVDHSAYYLNSMGLNGFCKMLPVVFDHLMNPLLLDETFVANVHHIDPETYEDKGLVYSTVEAMEAQSTWMQERQIKRQIMFDAQSGYRYEPEGLSKLLKIVKPQEVRKFHEFFYTLDNMSLIVIGDVSETHLQKIMDQLSELLLLEKSSTGLSKPLVVTKTATTLAPRFEQDNEIEGNIFKVSNCDASKGNVSISWIGPLYTEPLLGLALQCVLEYLTEGPLSPLQKQLVETEDPLVDYCRSEVTPLFRSILNIDFYDISTPNLQKVKKIALNCISSHRVDIERMKQVVETHLLTHMTDCEGEEGAELFARAAISDLLYGDAQLNTLETKFNNSNDYNTLRSFTQEEWQHVYDTWLCENKPIVAVFEPSSELYEQVKEEKAQLLSQRYLEFGEMGHQHFKEILEGANKKLDVSIPEDMLTEFISEDAEPKHMQTTSVSCFIESDNVEDDPTLILLKTKLAEFPLMTHIEHFSSEFMEMHLSLNTEHISDVKILPFYHVFSKMFTMPMNSGNDGLISSEKVTESLRKTVLDSSITKGFHNEFPECVFVNIRAKYEEYGKCVEWIKHIFYDMVFDEKRVTRVIETYLSNAKDSNCCPNYILDSLMNVTFLDENCLTYQCDEFVSRKAMSSVLLDIKKGEYDMKVLPKLEQFRDGLLENFGNSLVAIFGDVEKIGINNLYQPWADNFPAPSKKKTGNSFKMALSEVKKADAQKKAFVYKAEGYTTNLSSFVVTIPLNVDYEHEDYAALLLAIEFLQNEENSCYMSIIDQDPGALVYFRYSVFRGALIFASYQTKDMFKCYKGLEMMISTAIGLVDTNMLDRVLRFKIAEISASGLSYVSVADSHLINVYDRSLPLGFNEQLIQKMKQVNSQDVLRVMDKYFKLDLSTVFVIPNPTDYEETNVFFKKEGYAVENMETFV